MNRKLTAIILIFAMSLSLGGCAGIFDKEYVSVSNYVPAVQDDNEDGDRITVKNFSELKQAIVDLVTAGETENTIVFDPAYEGDTTEDMASACWQVRTRDALCAYCVENIAYELTKIVTYYESNIFISYSTAVQSVADIVKMQYSTGLEDVIRTAFENGVTKQAVLISRSSYSAENIELYAAQVYKKYPASAPSLPQISVNMYSGTGMQRLYEINLNYGMSSAELKLKRQEIEDIKPFKELDTTNMDLTDKALEACRYLAEHCSYTNDTQYNNIYSALIRRLANSEGIAFAYLELCRQLGVNCQIVYGQRDWQDYCWNIIEIDGFYYHVDVGACIEGEIEDGFLLNDEKMWVSHRWDVSSYPRCTGELSYAEAGIQ